MSTLKVDGIRSNSASSDAITLASDGTCTANITNNLSNRNLIINGAMQVAQRGTSSTVAEAFVMDRFRSNNANNDENPTQSQADVASGTTPYTLGFRKSLKMTNGNQTSGAGTTDRACILYNMEAQDIVNSGWNYTSATSYITIQFWVKASVSQNYYVALRSRDGTEQGFAFETGVLSADTWTKVTKTIPGNSNIQFDNDNGIGLGIEWNIFRGTAKTGSITLDQWAAFDGSARVPDMTSTWYTTNDATFEITGVQLEVGDHATDFEHRSFGDELRRCQRYYHKIQGDSGDRVGIGGYAVGSTEARFDVFFPETMRSNPTLGDSGTAQFDANDDSADFNLSDITIDSTPTGLISSLGLQIVTSGMTAGQSGGLRFRSDSSFLSFSAEL